MTQRAATGRTLNLYDHLLLRNEVASAEFLGNARVLDVREVAVTERVFYETNHYEGQNRCLSYSQTN